jgi:hypothetical protein
MVEVALARWQFAITSVYHFFFVPLTLGLSILVALMETVYVRTGDETYKRMAKFWGKLFLINFAMGVVTGIVMEFQFGMNWSEYSRFGIFPGIDVPGHLGLRMGAAVERPARRDDLAGGDRFELICSVDFDC